MNKAISHPLYGSRTTFTVEDSGNGWQVYGDIWLDFWWGFCSTCSSSDGVYNNYDRAKEFGVKTFDYNYTY